MKKLNSIIILYIAGKIYGSGHQTRMKIFHNYCNINNISNRLIDISSNNFDYVTFVSEIKDNDRIFIDVTNNNFINKKKLVNFIKSKIKIFKFYILDTFDNSSLSKLIPVTNNIKYIIPYFYKFTNKKNYYSGLKYFIIDNNFKYIKHSLKKNVMNILITFGGSNNSIAQKILNNLINFHEYKLNIKIIMGKFNSSVNINTKHTIHSITYIKFVKSIFPYLSWSDLVITSSGLTKYEAIYTRTPSIVIEDHYNDRFLNKYLSLLNTNSFVEYPYSSSKFNKIFNSLIFNFDIRYKNYTNSYNLLDDNAMSRIFKIIKS